uniref:ABC transporter permease n=1 Tax=Gongylonema pulchrum TaxID=637853 RepID=A0A183DLV1_9BILA
LTWLGDSKNKFDIINVKNFSKVQEQLPYLSGKDDDAFQISLAAAKKHELHILLKMSIVMTTTLIMLLAT